MRSVYVGLLAVALATMVLPGCLSQDPGESSSSDVQGAPAGDQGPSEGAPEDPVGEPEPPEQEPEEPQVLTFQGEASAGWRTPVGPTEGSRDHHPFTLDPGVGHIAVALDYEGSPQALDAALVDAMGRIQCQATQMDTPKTCTSPVPTGGDRR